MRSRARRAGPARKRGSPSRDLLSRKIGPLSPRGGLGDPNRVRDDAALLPVSRSGSCRPRITGRSYRQARRGEYWENAVRKIRCRTRSKRMGLAPARSRPSPAAFRATAARDNPRVACWSGGHVDHPSSRPLAVGADPLAVRGARPPVRPQTVRARSGDDARTAGAAGAASDQRGADHRGRWRRARRKRRDRRIHYRPPRRRPARAAAVASLCG